MSNLDQARNSEVAKYQVAYEDPHYRMGKARLEASVEALDKFAHVGDGCFSLLDVGCGRGEILRHAVARGNTPVLGVEAIPELLGIFDGFNVIQGRCHELPIGSREFDIVSCFDVLEHLIPEDVMPAVRELERVARKRIIISAADYSHVYKKQELHPSRRPYSEWLELLSTQLRPTWHLVIELPCGASRIWVFSR